MSDASPAVFSPDGRGDGPPPPSATFFLINLGRRARMITESRLAENGLSFHHLAALGHLSRQPGMSYSELARRAGVTVQSMQATIRHLSQQRLVERGPGGGQGRRADLRLTPRGREMLITGEAEIQAVDDELLAGFSEPERTEFERALFRLFRAQAGASGPGADAGG